MISAALASRPDLHTGSGLSPFILSERRVRHCEVFDAARSHRVQSGLTIPALARDRAKPRPRALVDRSFFFGEPSIKIQGFGMRDSNPESFVNTPRWYFNYDRLWKRPDGFRI